jgi:uncharacterized membrane protein YadS
MTINDACFLIFVAGLVFTACFLLYMRLPPKVAKPLSYWAMVAAMVAIGLVIALMQLQALRCLFKQ